MKTETEILELIETVRQTAYELHVYLGNGNPSPIFSTELVTVFRVKVPSATDAGLMHYDELRLAKGALTEALSGYRKNKKASVLRVFDIIYANNDISLSAVSDAISASKSAVNTYISFMKDIGVLERDGGRFGGKWRIKAPRK